MNAASTHRTFEPAFLREAIQLSFEKMQAGEGGPFGAVIVRQGEIVGRGWNRVTSTNDPTAHAEVVTVTTKTRAMTPLTPDRFLQAAINEARKGLAEGGIPIGSVLVIDGRIVGRGHNRRVQRGSAILHAEMDAIENAGRPTAREYGRATLYSTLSPCDMCSGAALLYRIPRIIIGENRTFRGPEDYTRSRGIQLEVRDDPECLQLMQAFVRAHPELWNEDIGILPGPSSAARD